MGRSPSPEPEPAGGTDEALVGIAERAILAGLDGGPAMDPDLAVLPAALRRHGAAFVTVRVDGSLNGCIGSVEPVAPLAEAVAKHAWSAAFADPRLPPLRRRDYGTTEIEISILSELSPVAARSRRDLIAALRAGIDGLVVEIGRRRAVYLPSVWHALETPERFVAELFAKAGVDCDYWGDDVEAWTFTVRTVAGRPGGPATLP